MSGKISYAENLYTVMGKINRFGVFGNHKLFLPGKGQTLSVVEKVARGVVSERLFGVTVGIAPNGTWLVSAGDTLENVPNNVVKVISQTVDATTDGAFTTSVSPLAVKNAGAKATLLNHYEQKTMFGGITPELNLRILAAINQGLDVILCIGQPKQHPGVSVEDIYENQLASALVGLPVKKVLGHLLLALEPGNLIGEEMPTLPIKEIEDCRKAMYAALAKSVPDFLSLPFIYGGGVTADNVDGLIRHFASDPYFVGTLPGSASNEVESFLGVIRNTHRVVVPAGTAKAFVDMALAVEKKKAVVSEGPRILIETPVERKPRIFGRSLSVSEIAQKMEDRPIRVGIMGFGEIGKAVIESAVLLNLPVEIAWASNRDLSLDDAMGRASKFEFLPSWAEFSAEGEQFRISGRALREQKYSFFSSSAKDIKPVAEHFAGKADMVVISANPLMKDRSTIAPFLENGVQLAVLTSMSTVDQITSVVGVNDDQYQPGVHKILAEGSCTGNAATTISAAIEAYYGEGSIRGGIITTPHSITVTQEISTRGMDPKAEASLNSIVPTGSGLKDLFGKPGFFPGAAGTLSVTSFRTPVEYASALEMSLFVEGAVPGQENELRAALKQLAASPRFDGILKVLEKTHGTRYAKNSPYMVETYLDNLKIFSTPGAPNIGLVHLIAAFGNVPGYAANIIRSALLYGYQLRQAGLLD